MTPRLARFLLVVAIALGDLLASAQSPTVTDISPDIDYGASQPASFVDTGGRIWSLAIDPEDDSTLYAAIALSAVWKTTDGGRSWKQSSTGMRNGIEIFSNTSLALDSKNPKHLIYATSSLDGRPNSPFGGLWVSTNGADSWYHAELSSTSGSRGGLCPGNTSDISSVAFDSGQSFVAAPCGLLTNSDSNQANGKWRQLPSLPFNAQGAILAPNGSGSVLFVCQGNFVYRSETLGRPRGSHSAWQKINLGANNICQALSVAPLGESKPTTVVVGTRNGSKANQPAVLDVVVADFATDRSTSLKFSGQPTLPNGSGYQGVFTVRRPGVEGTTPGKAYDIYAGDTCSFWFYGVEPGASSKPQWEGVSNPTGAGACGGGIHADSWYVVFPKSYDPAKGICTAYAATDGGVFVNSSSVKASPGSGCLLRSGWVTAMHGLHGFRSYTMAGISQPLSKCANPKEVCPVLYLPSGDNDVWASINGKNWGSLSYLGDAGEVHVDPAFPTQVITTRGSTYVLVSSSDGEPPLTATAQATNIAPPNASNSPSHSAPGNPEFTQVMSLPGESANPAFYVTSESPPHSRTDVIVKNTASQPTASTWQRLEASGIGFPLNQVAQIRSSGGIKNPVFYVLTASGKVYKGSLENGLVKRWNSVSEGLVNAEALFVDPYDSHIAYVSDVEGNGLPSIKSTSDGGKKWNPEPDLSKIASNDGEFLSFSSVPANVSAESYPPLSGMYFDRGDKNIRVAATYPGGVAFSDDAGKHWTQLLVTDNGPNNGRMNPVAMVTSVFYDPVLDPETRHPRLYVGLRSRGLIEVDCPDCPPRPRCTSKIQCNGDIESISCLGPNVGVVWNGNCHGPGVTFAEDQPCRAGFNGSSTIKLGPETTPVLSDPVSVLGDPQPLLSVQACTSSAWGTSCITYPDPLPVPTCGPSNVPNNPVIQCPSGLKWCGDPPSCKPPNACQKQAPSQR